MWINNILYSHSPTHITHFCILGASLHCWSANGPPTSQFLFFRKTKYASCFFDHHLVITFKYSVKNKYIWCVELSTEVSGWGGTFSTTLCLKTAHTNILYWRKKKNVRIKPNEHLQKQTQMLDLRFSGTTLHLCAVKIITEEQTRHSDLTCSGRIFS